MLPNRRVWAGLLVATSLTLFATLDGAGTAWRQIRGDHFVLSARSGVKDLSAVACDLERVAGALHQVYGESASPAVSASVIAVDNERDLRELLPQFWERRGARPLGAYWSGLYGHHIVIRVDVPPRERLRRMLHEYAHFATHLAYPDAPPWLDEGLSEIWTHAAIETDRVEIGGPVNEHVKILRSGKNWIPVAELISASRLPAAEDARRVRLFYAESWALAHYLAFEKRHGVRGLTPAPDRADVPGDEELRRYAQRPRLATARLTTGSVSEGCADAEIRRLSDAESSILKAQMLADGERPDAALPPLRDVLRDDPANVEAMETLAFVDFVGNRPTEAAAIFDRVIATGSASFLSYFYRAVLAARVPLRDDGSGPVPVADYLTEALRLNPGFEPARARLFDVGSHR